MAAFDMADPQSVVSPGGVGFDINCGVRLLRTNLHAKDVLPIKVIFEYSLVAKIQYSVSFIDLFFSGTIGSKLIRSYSSRCWF